MSATDRTPDPGSDPGADTTAPGPARKPLRLGPDKIVLFPVVVAFLGGIPAAASSIAFTWILLLPVVAGVWVFRARVVADAAGIEVCNGLGVRRVAWSEVGGFDVPKRGFVRLRLLPGAGRDRLPLTAMPRRDLPRLIEAAAPSA